ncbi:MAG: cadherin-like beta sandwich domain-containing protein [Oscillospiraceae bacterium]|nr:cadherin-like beta sandwich domain-containing protein [Oscillospiraceae bacterium]
MNNLNIEAIPQNSNATINITGNTNLTDGLNEINIEVISEDGAHSRTYTINTTRTNEPQRANARLAEIAVERYTLHPENMFNYTVRVSSTTENINILAIPESANATVNISNIEQLNFGENNIQIAVTAENGVTTQNYTITAYRMTTEEEEEQARDRQENARRLSAIMNQEQPPGPARNTSHLAITIIGVIAIIALLTWHTRKHRKKRI